MTFSVTLTATPAAPRFAWRDGRDRSAKKVTDCEAENVELPCRCKSCLFLVYLAKYNFILSEDSRFAVSLLLDSNHALIQIS